MNAFREAVAARGRQLAADLTRLEDQRMIDDGRGAFARKLLHIRADGMQAINRIVHNHDEGRHRMARLRQTKRGPTRADLALRIGELEQQITDINRDAQQLHETAHARHEETADNYRRTSRILDTLEERPIPTSIRRVVRTYVFEGDPVWIAETLARALPDGVNVINAETAGRIKGSIAATTDSDTTVRVDRRQDRVFAGPPTGHTLGRDGGLRSHPGYWRDAVRKQEAQQHAQQVTSAVQESLDKPSPFATAFRTRDTGAEQAENRIKR